MDQLLAGTTPFRHSSFWLLTLLKFKPNGTKRQYQDYFQTSVFPSLVHAGGHLILELNDSVRTLINGGGSLSDYDACTILSFPSPASYQSMLSKYQYVSGLNKRHRVVAKAELHAFDGQWHNTATPTTLTNAATASTARTARTASRPSITQPNVNLSMFEPTRLARIAHSNISGNKGRKDGCTFGCGPKGVHSLTGGVKYDLIACMKYPSRDAFVQSALPQNGEPEDSVAVEEQQHNGHDRHVLRTAGVQIQGLISLSLGRGQGQDTPAALALTVSRL